jgi:hypothetical protein
MSGKLKKKNRVGLVQIQYISSSDYFVVSYFNSNLETNAKPVRVGIPLAPIPACREDFSRMKLTSFDKLIDRTCSAIKNVRLCREPDHRPGGSTGNSGVAPDAV